LTIHKAQGSDFDIVFLVLPAHARIVRRELLYTALTRSRQQLVLLTQGDDLCWLLDLSRPAMSDTLRRNSNLFSAGVRQEAGAIPFAERLIHRADDGTMLRSKSELVIANKLAAMQLPYRYEAILESTIEKGRVLPDFTFVDAGGDRIVWEHLGMMSRSDYRRSWEWKLGSYTRNGFTLGQNLFTTEDDEQGGLDSTALTAVAADIAKLL
jgi:hypothetical protein